MVAMDQLDAMNSGQLESHVLREGGFRFILWRLSIDFAEDWKWTAANRYQHEEEEVNNAMNIYTTKDWLAFRQCRRLMCTPT